MPIGVSILPRFAASVCNTASGTASLSSFAERRTIKPNGTKVISDTSFVTSILRKKGRKTSTSIILRDVFAFFKSLPARNENTPALWKPFITAISENSKARVSQSM